MVGMTTLKAGPRSRVASGCELELESITSVPPAGTKIDTMRLMSISEELSCRLHRLRRYTSCPSVLHR